MQSTIIFSHLRWNFVFQRPQHVATRLAQRRRVYFFEEPVTDAAREEVSISQQAPNLWVCRAHSTSGSPGFHDDQILFLRRALRELMQTQGIDDYGVWFYSPMALPLIQGLAPSFVAYDCMDELSAFRNAPRQLLQRENALLKIADVVFTGGPSLYRAKRERHPRVYCMPSSVDAAHFRQARDRSIEHPLQRELPPGPRLGYFGVIDERLDLQLIDAVAVARPHWQLAMVGPHVKVDPEALPRRPNIHYFGQQPYADLPRFVAGWDVCLQPFALNEATRFISPTKTLEYMAAEKPIVSTPIVDVREPYGHIAYIARAPEVFIAACDHALRASYIERNERVAAMREVLEKTSWDDTVARMQSLLDEPLPQRAAARSSDTVLESRVVPGKATSSRDYRAIVIGAGPTGLSAAYHLGKDSLLLEQNSSVGGWCRSVQDRGFTFDYAGHIMFSNDPYVLQLYEQLLGDNVHWQQREAWIYSKGVYTRYPFQGALYGLPPDVLKECIVGAIEARFGQLKPEPATNAATVQAGSSACVAKAESITDCCADGITESSVTLGALSPGTSSSTPRNFEEFIYKVWGAGVAKHFAIPYNRKLWAVPLAEMETSWLGGRVPLPDLEEMIEGALRPVSKPLGPNARFGYPLRGGFAALMNAFLPLLTGELRTNATVTRVSPKSHKVTLADGRTYGYEKLVSTMPLPALVHMLGNEAPADIVAAARKLRHVSVRCVNLGIGRANLTDKHWIYYPEETVFHRIFVQGNASPHCNPPGGFGLTCEITYSPSKPLPCDGEELIERCIADCVRVGMIREDDPIWARNQVDMPYAYVVYDHERRENVRIIREWLARHDILLAGRYSEWEYYNSDHAFIAGKKAAEAVAASLVDDAEEVPAAEGA